MLDVFIVEDEPRVAQLLQDICKSMGLSCEWSDSLTSAKENFPLFNPKIVITDLLLENDSAIELVEFIRLQKSDQRTGILVISAAAEYRDRIEVLYAGADDFVCKPFHPGELKARIQSLLRRCQIEKNAPQEEMADFGSDFGESQVSSLNLTVTENRILQTLKRNRNSFLDRDKLKRAVWQETHISDKTLDTHLANLRRKLKDTDLKLINKFGYGYSLQKQR